MIIYTTLSNNWQGFLFIFTTMEALLEIVLLILFKYPGAFIIWMFTGFQKPFKKVLEKDGYFLGMIGLITISLGVYIISTFV